MSRYFLFLDVEYVSMRYRSVLSVPPVHRFQRLDDQGDCEHTSRDDQSRYSGWYPPDVRRRSIEHRRRFHPGIPSWHVLGFLSAKLSFSPLDPAACRLLSPWAVFLSARRVPRGARHGGRHIRPELASNPSRADRVRVNSVGLVHCRVQCDALEEKRHEQDR